MRNYYNATTGTTLIRPDTTTQIPLDFIFLSNIEYAVYDTNISANSLLLFNTVIDQIYLNLENPIAPFIPPDLTPYKTLNSYFIFTKFLNANNVTLNNNSDAINTQNLLINTIETNLVTNIVVLKAIFASMTNRFSIATFKHYIADMSTGSTTYQKVGGFTNLSLVNKFQFCKTRNGKTTKGTAEIVLPNEESDFNCAFNLQAEVLPIKTFGTFPQVLCPERMQV